MVIKPIKSFLTRSVLSTVTQGLWPSIVHIMGDRQNRTRYPPDRIYHLPHPKTSKLWFFNMTEETVFVMISGDTNPFRGICFPPGNYVICLAGYKYWVESENITNSRLIVTVKPRPYDVCGNYKMVQRKAGVMGVTKYVILPLDTPPRLKYDLMAKRANPVDDPINLFPVGKGHWNYKHKVPYKIQFWKCDTNSHMIFHRWVSVQMCHCSCNSNDHFWRTLEMYKSTPDESPREDDHPHAYDETEWCS